MAQRTLWGSTISWPANLPTGQRRTIINAAIDTTCTPVAWGIQINAVVNPGILIAAGAVLSLRAEIEWGALGGSQTVSVDVLNGATLNLVGHSVKVTIVDDSDYNGINPTTSPFTVSGSCAPSIIPKTQPTTRTLTIPAPVAGTFVEIPDYARKLSVLRFNASAVNSGYTLQFYDQATTTIGSVEVAPMAELENYMLPGQSRILRLLIVGAGVTYMSLIFELDL